MVSPLFIAKKEPSRVGHTKGVSGIRLKVLILISAYCSALYTSVVQASWYNRLLRPSCHYILDLCTLGLDTKSSNYSVLPILHCNFSESEWK